jgi:hypothetical protein
MVALIICILRPAASATHRFSYEWPDSPMSGARHSSASSAAHQRLLPVTGEPLLPCRIASYTETARTRMSRTLQLALLLAMACPVVRTAPRTSWNRVYYAGGTVQIKTSPYDWNTTLTVTPDAITAVISPGSIFGSSQTIRIKPSQVVAIWYDAAAWVHAAEVPGARVPAKPPSLFGLMMDSVDYASFAIIYETPDGKRGVLLFESAYSGAILNILKDVTGKTAEKSP